MGAIIRHVNRTMEERAEPRPSITCPPPSAWAEPFSDCSLIIVITDLRVVSSVRCTFKAILGAERTQELAIIRGAGCVFLLSIIRDMEGAITVRASWDPEVAAAGLECLRRLWDAHICKRAHPCFKQADFYQEIASPNEPQAHS